MTDSYHPDPLAQARANIEMMRDTYRERQAIAIIASAECRHRGAAEALTEAMHAIDAELAAAPTVTIPKPQPDDSGISGAIFLIGLGAVSALVVVGVIRWVL